VDIHQIINDIIVFYQNAPFVAIAIAIVVIFLLFRYTKLFLKFFLLGLLLLVVFYLISNLASSGVSQKEKLIEKGRVTDTEK
jgi:energy-coupling factor transporter transmembrane protein EcfT